MLLLQEMNWWGSCCSQLLLLALMQSGKLRLLDSPPHVKVSGGSKSIRPLCICIMESIYPIHAFESWITRALAIFQGEIISRCSSWITKAEVSWSFRQKATWVRLVDHSWPLAIMLITPRSLRLHIYQEIIHRTAPFSQNDSLYLHVCSKQLKAQQIILSPS